MADEDEGVADSWEEAADSEEFERRMEEREKLRKEEEKSQENTEMNSVSGPIKILKAENVGRTEYTRQIKIMRRSVNSDTKKDLVKQNTEAELKKTLKVREAEYQAARNRILGENYDETKPKLECEEVMETKISIIKPPSRLSPTCPSSNLSSPGASSIRVLTSPGSSSNTGDDSSILRQPHGPDNNSSGFSIQR